MAAPPPPLRPEGDWERDGFVVVRSAYGPERTARLCVLSERVLTQCKLDGDSPVDGPRPPGTDPGALTSLRHLNHPRYFAPGSPDFVTLMEAIADQAVLSLVQGMLRSPPVFRVSSLFFNPLLAERQGGPAAEGAWHRDCKFLIPAEADEKRFLQRHIGEGHTLRRGVAMQVALVRTCDLELVRGSHARYDTAEEHAVRLADDGAHATAPMPGAERIALEPGDAVIFNSYGFHRGRYYTNIPRRTLMWSYSSEHFATYDHFSDQPWLLEPGALAGLSPGATEFFGRYVALFRARIEARGASGAYVPYAEQVASQMEAHNNAAKAGSAGADSGMARL